jgi:hypothetical protein
LPPFGKCAQCDALPEDEQCALLHVFIKDLTVAPLIADGHSPDCAREAPARFARGEESDGRD